jgi:hypothetical protein
MSLILVLGIVTIILQLVNLVYAIATHRRDAR